jgi:hypothetical protein
MGEYKNTGTLALWEYYIIYLRKSRQDDPNETVEEVLAKHETMLQELALREFGGRIPEGNIYREVVSGESIDDRVEMQKVLARIEDPNVRGVLVIEPQRLSRGDLEDCGRLINDFRYTHTKVVTPMMTYDLEKKMDRRFFQDELLRGRDYLEYTKEILRRGREAAVKRGCFIMQNAPYGFNKIKIGKDHTLEPNDNADVVRMVFDWYVNEDVSWYKMAQRLEEMGVPAPEGEKWHKEVLSRMVRNQHYIGKVVYNARPTVTVLENGERKTKRAKSAPEDCIIAEGKHPAIIDQDTWDRAQEKAKNAPRLRGGKELANVLSGLLRCSCCGYIMDRRPNPFGVRYMCPARAGKQCFKSVKCDQVLDALRISLEMAELPALKSKVANDEGNARKIQERILAKLQKQMSEYRDQEDHQYELLETKKYTQELFDRRNAQLRAKMEECEKQIYLAKSAMPKSVNYAERVVALEAAIAALHDPEASNDEVNKVLKAIIERIEFTGTPSKGKYGPREGEGFKLAVFLRL